MDCYNPQKGKFVPITWALLKHTIVNVKQQLSFATTQVNNEFDKHFLNQDIMDTLCYKPYFNVVTKGLRKQEVGSIMKSKGGPQKFQIT